MLPLGELELGFQVVTINPCLISSDDGLLEVWVVVCTIQHVLSNFHVELLLLLLQQIGDEFCWYFCISKCTNLLLKRTDPIPIPTLWVIFWIVSQQSYMTIFQTSINSSFHLVDGLSECVSLHWGMAMFETVVPLFHLWHHHQNLAESSGWFELVYHQALGKTLCNITSIL